MPPKHDGPRPKSVSFPVKFKGLVSHVRNFSKDLRHQRRSSEVSVQSGRQVPAAAQAAAPSETVSRANTIRSSAYATDLSVQVSLSFAEPLDFSYGRSYESSPSLRATDRLCQGLLRRVDHCTQELITRKDRSALERTAAHDGNGKPLRFEVEVQIVREGEIWATRTYKSFQRQPLTADDAREITMSTHYMIGLFLRHHDDGFVWKNGPVRDDPTQPPETFPFRQARVQPMSCIPRFYFLDKAQEFESTPGYTISLNVVSRNPRHKSTEVHEEITVHSEQMSPLNLAVAEGLFFDTSYAIEGILQAERKAFRQRHASCQSSDGCKLCRRHEPDGLEVTLNVSNNLGPRFEHLERVIRSQVALFSHPQGEDVQGFVKKLGSSIESICREADDNMNQLNDLDFRITELRGRTWTLDEPIVYTLGPANSHSRRSIEGILDRVQTSVADILRGNAMTVRMTAHKRGHPILDKTLVAREPAELAGLTKSNAPPRTKAAVLERLRRRIEKDIEIVCRDTCTIEDIEEEEDVKKEDGSAQASQISMKHIDPEPEPQAKPESDAKRPATPAADQVFKTIENAPPAESPATEVPAAKEEEQAPSPSPAVDESPSLHRRPSSATRDPLTGRRSFPLMPSQEETENEKQDKDAKEAGGAHTPSEERGSTPVKPASPYWGDQPPRTPKSFKGSIHSIQREALSRAASSGVSTPSLTCAGGSSPRSSLLATPKNQDSSAGAEWSMPTPLTVEGERQPEKDASDETPVKASEPQPTQQSEMPTESTTAVPSSDVSGKTSTVAKAEKPLAEVNIEQTPKTPQNHRTEPLPPLPPSEFARSKPDFDMSDLGDDTSAASSQADVDDVDDVDDDEKEEEENSNKNNTILDPVKPAAAAAPSTPPHRPLQLTISRSRTNSLSGWNNHNGSPSSPALLSPTSPGSAGGTPNTAIESPTPRRTWQQQQHQGSVTPPSSSSNHRHRKSFGSAGFLGFHEERTMMDQARLRRALVGGGSPASRPGSRAGSSRAPSPAASPLVSPSPPPPVPPLPATAL